MKAKSSPGLERVKIVTRGLESLREQVVFLGGTGTSLLITKIEAFPDRGKGGFLSSHDIEDMVPSLMGKMNSPERLDDHLRNWALFTMKPSWNPFLDICCRTLPARPDMGSFLIGLPRLPTWATLNPKAPTP